MTKPKKYLHKYFPMFSNPKELPPPRRNYHHAHAITVNDVITGPIDFSPRFTDPPADVSRASKRFFVSAGPASSLTEEARLSATESPAMVADESTPVAAVSLDPYVDFRRSMQEMVDARHVDRCRPLDWGFMEELLTCYLELNDRSVHPCILRAFVDLTAGLRCQSTEEKRKKIKIA